MNDCMTVIVGLLMCELYMVMLEQVAAGWVLLWFGSVWD